MVTALPIKQSDVLNIPRGMDLLDTPTLNKGTAFTEQEKAAKISLTAYREDISLREAALKLGLLNAEQFDSWVRPEEMTQPIGGE
jgi:hypothetical protein